jgi:hypothetical protein
MDHPRTLSFVLLSLVAAFGFAAPTPAPLALGAGDVQIEAQADGYHLYIRQIPGVESVLLTEAFELPSHQLPTYALRSVGPNPVNDAEPRLLDGKFLKQPHHSLVSSTVVDHGTFGKAFTVLVPPLVEYGNQDAPGARAGRVDVKAVLASPDKPFWFSIRTFAKPYADYAGAYKDNAFELKSFLAQRPQPTLDHYEQGLYENFGRLGVPYRTTGIQDALDQVARVLDRTGDSLDMVIALDTTRSMVTNLDVVKQNLLAPIRAGVKKFKTFRIGFVFYRDYMEDYLTRVVAFSSDLDQVQKDLDQAQAAGGGDIPEAAVEATWAGLTSFRWTAVNKVLLVIGDAPQHPAPRGNVTEAMVRDRARQDGVEVEMLMLPQTLDGPGN